MANYVENEILERVRASPSFEIQLDESTDVANLAIVLLFVRYINKESVEEELLFCRPLKERTTGADIFKLTDEYFRENSIDRTHCVGICTDGAKSMTGYLLPKSHSMQNSVEKTSTTPNWLFFTNSAYYD